MQHSNIGPDSSMELLRLLCKGRFPIQEYRRILFRLYELIGLIEHTGCIALFCLLLLTPCDNSAQCTVTADKFKWNCLDLNCILLLQIHKFWLSCAKNFARLGSVSSQWLLAFSCEIPEILLVWVSFQVRRFDRTSEIDRSSAAFRFLNLIYFMDYSSDMDANFPCLCRRLPTKFLSLTASRAPSALCGCLGHETAQSRMRMRICYHACSPSAPLHAGGSRAIGYSAEPAMRRGPPSAWSRLNSWHVERNSKCSSRCHNLISANWQPPRRAAAALSAAGAGPAG